MFLFNFIFNSPRSLKGLYRQSFDSRIISLIFANPPRNCIAPLRLVLTNYNEIDFLISATQIYTIQTTFERQNLQQRS